MPDEENKPEEKPATNASEPSAEKPVETPAASAPPASEKPAEKPAEAPAVNASAPPPAEKPAEKPAEAPAPKPAAAAAPKAPEAPPAPPPVAGAFGKFLKEKGIESTPLPLSTDTETLELKASNLPAAIKLLRESPETKLNYLVAVSGIDSADTFDSVYHLWSYTKKEEVVLKVRIPKASTPADKLPEVPSISPDWPAANWHERETYDLVGIRYLGHPYLRRILNPWDWEGHPLRRDYKQPIDALNDKNPESMR